jgi:hypothetical protein
MDAGASLPRGPALPGGHAARKTARHAETLGQMGAPRRRGRDHGGPRVFGLDRVVRRHRATPLDVPIDARPWGRAYPSISRMSKSVMIRICTILQLAGWLHLRRIPAVSTIRPRPGSDRLHPSAREGTASPCGRSHRVGRNEAPPVRGMPFAPPPPQRYPEGIFAACFSPTPIGSHT